MTTDFMQSRLWLRTLGAEDAGAGSAEREQLRAAYLQFRSVVRDLAGEISISMPMFTDHSIDHIDALWDTASLLTGDEFPINPAEAFVMGGAFLLHDLGMGLAAFPGGVEDVVADPIFDDLSTMALAKLRTASAADADEDSLRKLARQEAISTVLRLRHAKQAERLASQRFRIPGGGEFPLLENTELRTAFGPIIGRIAHSHWFDVDDLPNHFPNVLGSFSRHPEGWHVDALKIACVLRLADAVHIDSRRAPTYLHAFRRPTGDSSHHWYFQQRLTRPRVTADRLEYTSNQVFQVSEAAAWWLAFDAIGTIDRELGKVDALCADLDRPRFLVRSVAGAESPDRLARFIPTSGWRPIDANLRVSQVSDVVSRLGGKELYGNRPEVALREAVANAADAVRARSRLFGGSDLSVVVRMKKENESYWLTVEDRGIGMSAEKLVSTLTDFGYSHWQSTEMASEYPGLISRGFKSTGQFGIGFFSIFMIADYVEVKSLKHFEAATETHILVFPNGLNTRPLLRVADESERLNGGGTVLRAKLKHDPLSEDGLFQTDILNQSRTHMLRNVLLELCALADVDIQLDGPDEASTLETLLRGNDWKTLPPRELFRRIYQSSELSPPDQAMYDAYEDVFAEHVRDLRDDNGDIIGRAILAAGLESETVQDLWWWPSPMAQVYVGGFHAYWIYDCLGAFCGAPLKADRFSAFPVATTDELRRWAESQAELVRRSKFATARSRYGAGDLARSVGADVPLLPCGFVDGGEILPAALIAMLRECSELLMIPSWELHVFHREDGTAVFIDQTRGRQVTLPSHAIVYDYPHWFFPEEVLKRPKDERFSDFGAVERGKWNPRRWWYYSGRVGSTKVILEAALSAWGCDPLSLADKFECLDFGTSGDQRLVLECVDGVGEARVDAYRMHRP
ncbi:ATP-binding protein [Micromonospora sp. WMMD980]|uniref:HD domain-containing protein n=1 Tax=Micromonospora sp. WMMD980 TaxID=3016088 RepID=UPI0024172837|nr:ATP-binding protein [Micromonospora sp. WMMD980]MDG4799435.1 ATP-binding protein [Micromonospora sp. WMMD980]